MTTTNHTSPSGEDAAPPNGIRATLTHDEGAIARCSYCGRYSLDPKTLSDRQPKCDCGEKHGWSGSFKKPGPDAEWSGAAPSAPQPIGEDAANVAIGEREAWDGDSKESRTAFRAYDSIAEPVSEKTPWQIWRDACAWQANCAASMQSTATQPAQTQVALTAAPRYREWLHLTQVGMWTAGVPTWARDHDGRMNDGIAMRSVIEELAALLAAQPVSGGKS
jgi:hypothetical protein